jgi:ATP-dependent RNA helicase DeaD
MFIVEETERRRAERLFTEARLRLRWTQPPSAEAIAAHDRERLRIELSPPPPTNPEARALAAQLLTDHDGVALVATLLARALAERPTGEPLTPVDVAPRPAPARKPEGGAMAVFQINLGAKDRAEANWILPLICRRGGITRREVGAIRVDRDRTYFEIAGSSADSFAASAAERDPRAPHVRIEPARELPQRSFTPYRKGKGKRH